MTACKNATRFLTLFAFAALALAGPARADDDAGYLGVMLQDLSSSMAKALQLDEASGVLVNEVVADGPAARAGLQGGDVIVSFAGKAVANSGDLTAAVRGTAPGTEVDVVVLRDGKRQTVKVELGERDDDFAWVGRDDRFFPGDDEDVDVLVKRLREGDGNYRVVIRDDDRGYLGVRIDDLSPQLGEHFGVEDGDGVLVTEVVEDSPAARAGLKAGDVIVRIGDDEVEDTGDLHEALAGTEADDAVTIVYVRDGKQRSVEVTLGDMPEGESLNSWYFGDDGDEYHIMAPKMMYRHMPHMGKHDVRVMRLPEGHVEIIRESEEAQEQLDVMRAELDKLRADLDELRQELKKQ